MCRFAANQTEPHHFLGKVFRFSEDGEENRQKFMLQVLPCVLISSIFFAIHVLHVRKTSQNYASQVGTYEELIPDAVRDPVAPNGCFVPTTGRSKIFQSTIPQGFPLRVMMGNGLKFKWKILLYY